MNRCNVLIKLEPDDPLQGDEDLQILYEGHEVKEEMVMGPVEIQRPNNATEQMHIIGDSAVGRGGGRGGRGGAGRRRATREDVESSPSPSRRARTRGRGGMGGGVESLSRPASPSARARNRGGTRGGRVRTRGGTGGRVQEQADLYVGSRRRFYCGIVDEEGFPEGDPLESPLHVKRSRISTKPRIRIREVSPASSAVAVPSPVCVEYSVPSSTPEIKEEARAAPVPAPARPAPARPWRQNKIEFVNFGSEDESENEENLNQTRTLFEFPNLPGEDEEAVNLIGLAEVEAEALAEVEVEAGPVEPPLPSVDHEPRSAFDFVWSAFPNPPLASAERREPFSPNDCGPTAPMPTPYDAFTAIWDRQIMEYIVAETNKYAQYSTALQMQEGELGPSSRANLWTDATVDEMYVYFAITIATGIVVKSDITEYWTKDSASPIETPNFSKYMTRQRFQLLNRYLHFSDNRRDISHLSRQAAKIHKVAPIVNHLNQKFQLLYRLSQNVALDESLTQWKGCLNIKQFIGNKAASVGIKTYEVCESSTGYVWRFEVHAGRDLDAPPQEVSPISGYIPSLVLHLLRGLENKGHTVWMDNFYNSPALARTLKSLGFDCVGTLRTNRQLVPPELASLNKEQMVDGHFFGATSGDVDILVWKDQNRVAMISTYHGNCVHTRYGKTKPIVVHDYNVCMGGVDKKDQMLALYPLERKRTRVWYKKFFRRLLNVSVLNAFILHKHDSSDDVTIVTAHRDFRKALMTSLLTRHCDQPLMMRQVLPIVQSAHILQHMPAEYDVGTNTRRRYRCVECRTRCISYCSGCNVPLCIFKCYGPYHSLKYPQ